MVEDILEQIPETGILDGYVEIAEGDFTKLIQLDTAYEIEFVEKLAAIGWVLVSIVPTDGKYVYWFQSKRKIYYNHQK